ncbi:helix-turn-helix domain-containing protein [Alistipes sp.]|uniref:helix-turn-helix domain-containing protein n=1 Tax=Alistipes sp. TaxID=1872444 RepID=UPI003529C9CA
MIDLQRFRKENKIKQSEICEVLGVKQPYVSAIESGVRPLNESQFRLLYNRYGDILLPYKTTERPIFPNDEEKKVEMSREVFEKISKLIDTVCSQQNTIADQHRTIDRLISSQKNSSDVRPADNADSAVAG